MPRRLSTNERGLLANPLLVLGILVACAVLVVIAYYLWPGIPVSWTVAFTVPGWLVTAILGIGGAAVLIYYL